MRPPFLQMQSGEGSLAIKLRSLMMISSSSIACSKRVAWPGRSETRCSTKTFAASLAFRASFESSLAHSLQQCCLRRGGTDGLVILVWHGFVCVWCGFRDDISHVICMSGQTKSNKHGHENVSSCVWSGVVWCLPGSSATLLQAT